MPEQALMSGLTPERWEAGVEGGVVLLQTAWDAWLKKLEKRGRWTC